ncbi:MAG: hypothetical protein ACREPR_19820 [Brasilonema sp.]
MLLWSRYAMARSARQGRSQSLVQDANQQREITKKSAGLVKSSHALKTLSKLSLYKEQP